MMGPDRFAMWKFKIIEGQIECNGYDFTTTKIVDGFNVWYVSYDPNTEMATIKNASNPNYIPITCRFSDVVDQLKKLKLWHERADFDKHSSAKVPF